MNLARLIGAALPLLCLIAALALPALIAYDRRRNP